ncbi:single-stranded DNA-binding protein 4 isoform X4 [Saccopteryx bilineata]|uniref:single-stranded DNA-binding protein 4 isoform X4 n=1 Tax=Saccopteryx bilineata TaxID=59482 RepID=UPI00338E609E
MYAKGGKGSAVPSDSQAREKLALYVYEYLLHIGAQKSAQTFLSEIRWEKNITLGEPPGFLHSWWCVFWDLYCAAPDRREACEHSSEAKAFQDYSAAAAPSPLMGSIAPNDAMAAGPMAPGFFQGPPGSQLPPHNPNAPMMGPHVQPFMSPQFPGGPRLTLRMPSQVRKGRHERRGRSWVKVGAPIFIGAMTPLQHPVGLPSSQALLPGAMDPSPCPQGHPSMGLMQRVTPSRGVASIGPQNYGGGMRPPPNSLAGPGLPTMNMGPGVRGPWASPSGSLIPYSASSPGSYTGPPGGGGPPGTPIIPSPGDSTNSSENMYTIMNSIGPGAGRANFPLDPGPEGPMAAMSTLEPHHVNGSLGAAESHVPVCLSSTGSGDIDGLPKSSPGAMAGLSTTPGTPRNDGEMAATGTFLHLFPSESYSPGMTTSA